uniref:Lysosomal alpha-mannosidase n=1 Tax=Aceria tosichella TaxID=561515 RepID=A0A6G1SA06_9ACAR
MYNYLNPHKTTLCIILLLTLWTCNCWPERTPYNGPITANGNSGSQRNYQYSTTTTSDPELVPPAPPQRTQSTGTAPKCGYKSCPKTDPKRLNVHIIAHTHDDVGWLKTVDQYFYGTNKRNSGAGVQYIMDTVVPQLLMDKSKRFIYVEMSFFTKWWNEQDEPMRLLVQQLVNDGQLEFINGGWCMNDEATVTYHSTIEQMTLGLKFLNETFGQCGRPKVGWQIDPFGHTNEQASLFAQFGFDGMFFTRIGYRDKANRAANKSLDLIWHGDRILQGQSGSIFTNIFRDGYDAPNGYCFDALCLDDAIVDNDKSYEYNVDSKGNDMIDFIRDYAKVKLTNHVLIPFGGDFQFTAAGQNFKSIDKLMKYIRQHAPDIHIFYSTPSCYQYAIYENANREKRFNLPEKYDDFMPYDSSSTVWWSGYFASRPSVKLIERDTANLLQLTRMLSLADLLRTSSTLSTRDKRNGGWIDGVRSHESKCLRYLWEVLGDLQHHDAITGTEKQHVTDDYERRVSDARKLCSKFIGDFKRDRLNEALRNSPDYEPLRKSGKRFHLDPVYLEDTMFCNLLNISQCDALESDININRFMNTTSDSKTSKPTSPSPPAADHKHAAQHQRSAPLPKELETKGVLVTAYNSLARPVQQMDFRLPCIGRCDLDKIQVIHVASNETMRLIRLPVPSGVNTLPFRDATTNYEILFYANIPALGSTTFVMSDENPDDIVDEESYPDDAILITDETARQANNQAVRSRRIRRDERVKVKDGKLLASPRYEYFTMMAPGDINEDDTYSSRPTLATEAGEYSQASRNRLRRRRRDAGSLSAQQSASDRVIVKFDMHSGVIVGLKRVSDGSAINITQKFGYYFPADYGHHPGAYIFRPNSSEPHLLSKPIGFRMYKRQNGALIEIHQKWSDWIWQTIRVDAKKNYIEFDYVVGPVPTSGNVGREVVTRYQTNMANDGVFLTDSGARQMLPRHRQSSEDPVDLGGSFYPVVSTIMIRNNKQPSNNNNRATKSAEAVSILVDRAQAGTSLNEGDLELLIHRRHLFDDNFGVGEPLNEPGEDGRGLVTRGKHRLFLKFQDQGSDSSRSEQSRSKPRKPNVFVLPRTPRENLTYEHNVARDNCGDSCDPTEREVHIVTDQLLNDIRQESIKYALKPILTFDRLRVSAREFIQMLSNNHHNSQIKKDTSLLNTTLPSNIHLLTLQPWDGGNNQILIRLENLDNPLTLHPTLDFKAYKSSLDAYKAVAGSQTVQVDPTDPCFMERYLKTEFDIKYMINGIRITLLEELNLGANNRLADDKRLDWTQERTFSNCDLGDEPTTITLRPRQIRTFLVSFEHI